MNLESILENIVGPTEHYYRSEQCYVYLYIYTHIYKIKLPRAANAQVAPMR